MAKFAFVISIAIIFQQNYAQSDEQINLSETNDNLSARERLLYGSRMASYMDHNADPCEDFHQYACGNFFKVHKESSVRGRFGSIFLLHDNLQDKIHEMLMEPVNTTDPDPGVENKARIYYQSCIKADLYPYKKSEIFLKFIESLGGWPVLNPNWKEENFDWFNVTVTLKSFGINTVIKERPYEPGYSGLSLTSFGLIPLAKYLHRPSSKAFQLNKDIARHIMTMYGVSKAKSVKTFKEIISFGKDLEEFRKQAKLIKSEKYEDMTLKELVKFMPGLNWTKYYSAVYKDEELMNMNISVSYKTILKLLPKLFKGKNIRNGANYFMLKVLFNLHSELQYSQDQKIYCLAQVQEFMQPVISAIFLESKYHDKNIEDEIIAMASYIRLAFRDSLKSAKWVDKMSRKGAIKNLQNIDIEIGDSELTLDMEELNKKYSKLDMKPDDDFHNNTIRVLQFIAANNPLDEETYAIEVNAYYSPWENKLIIPGGIFRRPFYYPELPKSYNFGAIGTVLGHEFTHSMDGNQIDQDWWREESTKEFQQRAMCFVEQYSNYKIKELNRKLQGNMTLEDDIADNGGIRHSFYGYKKWVSANQGNVDISKQILPGLNMTDTQIYFLSFAQVFCESIKGFRAHKHLTRDDHSPGKWRIIGALSNFDEFSKAFNCKLGSGMNPGKKCVLW